MGYLLDGAVKWLNKLTSTDGIKIKTDGSLRAVGDSVLYDDLVGDIFSKKLYNTSGKVDYDWAENCIKFQASGSITNINDLIQTNIQLPHKAVIGTSSYLRFHIHWFQEDTVQRTLTMQYRLQNNGETKDATWKTLTLTTADTNDLFTYASGAMNQITTFPEIDISTADITSTLQIKLTRTDSNAGLLNVSFLDAHIAIDSDGSTSEWSKEA